MLLYFIGCKKMMSFKLSGRVISSIAGAAFAVFAVSAAHSQLVPGGCGYLENGYGPYDARTDHAKLPVVMFYHFTPAIENLIEGTNTTTVGSDLDYTLRAVPNYHRALIAMVRLAERQKTDKPRTVRYTVECWFQRAIAFRADDAIVRMIYSTYLNKKRRVADANAQLEAATVYAKDNGFTHYNIGLHYFDLKNYDKALAQAHKAMALGFTLTELKTQLVSVGKWSEPVEPPVSSAPAANEPAEQAK
jgi:tetratricopeptide (TPR) repeat protein